MAEQIQAYRRRAPIALRELGRLVTQVRAVIALGEVGLVLAAAKRILATLHQIPVFAMRELSQLLAELIQAHRRRAPIASRARLLRQQAFLHAPTATRARLLPQQAVLHALIVALPVIKR